MASANLPSFSATEFDKSSPSAYASNLTATWGEFYNEAHIDNDVNSISYGGWCGINQQTGKPASQADGFDVEYGQFVLPGISTVVDFNAIDGWTDLFWASNLLYHQTVKSQKPSDSPFSRFAFSVQINKTFYDSCVLALKKTDLVFGGLTARDAQVREKVFEQLKSASEECVIDSVKKIVLPEPHWPEVSTNQASSSTRNPPLPPSNPNNLFEDNKISIITPEAFLENIKRKRQAFKDALDDKTLPLSIRVLTQKVIEAMDKSRDGMF
ncbi:hypothetical protein PGTUg99_006732 [Puccinia graminis f. sp. tritici]|uniref:Tet-like 2OG-Fe(II) oxygenase domain-containing protein n=1 Tax=Puccinia graminis f. sp. tritici TaxID=56615 RepID=A0A5B0SAR3_PUCGR|nr:hypothetical protein PGTUg99_006732 [Puccinia graminis f. sp. tritici]